MKNIKLCIFEMSFPIEERTICVLWYTKSESTVPTQRRFVQRFGRETTFGEKFIFMQDGAPPHWLRTVRQWLNHAKGG